MNTTYLSTLQHTKCETHRQVSVDIGTIIHSLLMAP